MAPERESRGGVHERHLRVQDRGAEQVQRGYLPDNPGSRLLRCAGRKVSKVISSCSGGSPCAVLSTIVLLSCRGDCGNRHDC